MKIDYSPRQSGKTTRMVKWLREDKRRVLIVFGFIEKKRLAGLHKGIESQVMTWSEYKSLKGYERVIKEISIDNAETILKLMVNHEISNITISSDDQD